MVIVGDQIIKGLKSGDILDDTKSSCCVLFSSTE